MLWFSLSMATLAAPLSEDLAPPPEGPPSAPGPVDLPVVNGTDAPEGLDEVVGLAFYDESTELLTVFCTGSVIQDDWILTAAHCIDETNTVQQVPGCQRVAVWGEDILLFGADEIIPWREAFVSPVYNANAFTGDAGLVQLERPKADARWVVLRDEPFGEDQIGQSIEVFGFGATGDGRGDSGRKRTTVLPIEDVDESNIITFTPKSNVCSGDSGGPGFLPRRWGYEQVGINAFVTPGCIGGRGGSTRVDVHIDWILELVPGVALDPDQLPSPEPEDQVDEGERFRIDFGADDPEVFAVELEEGEGPATGCATAPLPAVAGLLPLLALLRRRTSASTPSP